MKYKANIELCEMTDEDVSGRTRIKMTAIKIHDDDNDHNGNGITWKKDYVEKNLKSMIGASYKVSFVDDDKMIPSDHGTMDFDENGNVIFKDSDTVGSIQKAYIDIIEIDGVDTETLVTEGYIYNQSYPNFVEWLRDETNSGTVYGSVEINGKSKAKKIIYANGGVDEDGNLKVGRQPKVFDFVSVAILSSMSPPADYVSQVLEINSKEGQILKKVKSAQKVEINELSYDDIATLVTRAFNSVMREKDNYDEYCYRYWIHKFYPTSRRVVMQNDYEIPCQYYMTTYEIDGNSITLGDISEVEMDWKPVNNEQEVEINTAFIKDILQKSKKEDNQTMDKDNNKDVSVVELNAQIVDKVNEINTLTNTISDKDVEINTLKEKEVELNQLIVEANKTIEAQKQQITELNTEIEPLRELKTEKETKEKQAEINTYFETVKSENGFTEIELNTLKEKYVDKGDLEGLKSAETELCVKKVKEMKKVENIETEVNSLNEDNLFFSTKIETVETNASEDGSDLFK